jgi:hypothetical protein
MEKHEISKWLLQEYVGYEEGGQLTPASIFSSYWWDRKTSLRYVQHHRERFWMMVCITNLQIPKGGHCDHQDLKCWFPINPKDKYNSLWGYAGPGHGGCTNDLLAWVIYVPMYIAKFCCFLFSSKYLWKVIWLNYNSSLAEHNFYSQLCSSPIWPRLMARAWIVDLTPIEKKNELSFKKIVLVF